MYYLIYSKERNQYWNANCWGYTSDVRSAGRFDEVKAKQIEADANINNIVNEILIPVKDFKFYYIRETASYIMAESEKSAIDIYLSLTNLLQFECNIYEVNLKNVAIEELKLFNEEGLLYKEGNNLNYRYCLLNKFKQQFNSALYPISEKI
jgi:hypothetical protein